MFSFWLHTSVRLTCHFLLPFVSTQPPYAEIVDDCTKYICVNNQLVLFNKSQSCPFTSDPPNCGLLGFAVLVNGDKCCPKWDCPCEEDKRTRRAMIPSPRQACSCPLWLRPRVLQAAAPCSQT